MSEALVRRVAKGALWLLVARWGVRLIGIASTILLARLLRPTDYGLVGLAMLLYSLVQSAGDFSLDMDLIRSGSRERERYDTVWTLEIARGLANAALVLLLAIPAATILHEPRLVGLSGFVAAIAAISGFVNVGTVEFRSELVFARECAYTLLIKLASFVVAVPLAFAWRDYRALVAGLVASAAARLVLSFALHPYRPRLSLARFRDVFSFSKWLWFSSQLFFVRTRSDELFVGKFAGVAALGFYRIARTVAELPMTELITPVLAAIFPGFSKLSGEGRSLSRGYLAVLAGGLCLMAPLAFGLLVTADLVLDLGFGRQWVAAAPLLRLLAFVGPLELLVGNAYAVFVAMGRPRLFTYTSLVNAASFLLLLVLLVPAQGAVGAAMALVGASLVGGGLNLVLAQRVVGLPAADVAEALWRPFVAGASMAAFLGAFRQTVSFAPGVGGEALMLAACIVLGAAIYTVVLFTLWAASSYPKGAEATIVEFIAMRVRRKMPALARLSATLRVGK